MTSDQGGSLGSGEKVAQNVDTEARGGFWLQLHDRLRRGYPRVGLIPPGTGKMCCTGMSESVSDGIVYEHPGLLRIWSFCPWCGAPLGTHPVGEPLPSRDTEEPTD